MFSLSRGREDLIVENKITGWKCLHCDWEQKSLEPEPPFTELPCECCWDFECPKCGCAVEHYDFEKEEVRCPDCSGAGVSGFGIAIGSMICMTCGGNGTIRK